MTEISKLIEADEINCQQSMKLFNHFDPSLSTSFDDAGNLLTVFSRSFGHGATDDDTQHSISEIAKEGGHTESEIRLALNGKKPSSMRNDIFEKIKGGRWFQNDLIT